jgi:transcriptional regulator with XRE-family HTH domain
MATTTLDVSATLRDARHAAQLSQLALALRVGVSQRHLSFVESGRARPSRRLILAWLREVGAPLTLQNAALLQAGFAPVYTTTALDDEQLATSLRAIERLLSAHDPMPALVLDADWNVIRANAGGRWFASEIMPPIGLSNGANLLDALAHPDGVCSRITNLREIAPTFVAQLHGEIGHRPSLATRVQRVTQQVELRLGTRIGRFPVARPTTPSVIVRYRTSAGELAFFSMFTTFGAPLDVTLESLRIEHFVAADDRTRQLLERHVVM